MNDDIFNGKRRLNETDALWNLSLGAVFEDERYLALQAYRDAVKDASKVITEAIDDWLERHPVQKVET